MSGLIKRSQFLFKKSDLAKFSASINYIAFNSITQEIKKMKFLFALVCVIGGTLITFIKR